MLPNFVLPHSFLCAQDMDDIASCRDLTETGISSFAHSTSHNPLLHSSATTAPASSSVVLPPNPSLSDVAEEEGRIYAFSSQEKQLKPRDAQMYGFLSASAINRVAHWRLTPKKKKLLLHHILTVYVVFNDNGNQRKKKKNNSNEASENWVLKKTRIAILSTLQ